METVQKKAAATCSCSTYAGMISAAPEERTADDMRFGGQGIYKKGRKEAPGARSVEELGWITSKLLERNTILKHGLLCGADLEEASKRGPKR